MDGVVTLKKKTNEILQSANLIKSDCKEMYNVAKDFNKMLFSELSVHQNILKFSTKIY